MPNAFGLVGGAANAPGPGKRPLSSMSPTIVLRDGKPVLVTSSPGGSRIITTVLQVIVGMVDFNRNVAAAVAAPRIHHQWVHDQVDAEATVADEIVAQLSARGQTVVRGSRWGSANSIAVTADGIAGAADRRSPGALAAGH